MLAFLNTDGGSIYLGLSDDGLIYGVDGDIDGRYRKTVNSFRYTVSPDSMVYFKCESEQLEGKWILHSLNSVDSSVFM